MNIAELAEKYGSLDLLTAYIMRTANVSQEKAEDRVVDIDFVIEQQLAELMYHPRRFICRECGEEFEFEEEDFDCCGSFHPDGEELLWGHIQLAHPDVFEEVRDLETPYMIEECYEEVED